MSSPTGATAQPGATAIPGISAHACARVTRAGARTRAIAVNRENPVTPGNAVTLLRHCRCIDCRKFTQDAVGEYFCEDYIGGTAIVWGTGRRVCDPPPDAWHYCAGYDGPQISKDVFVWPKASAGAKERPAPGGGGPSDGPLRPEPVGEDRSNRHHLTTPPPGSSAASPPDTRRAAQVGAGSNISSEVEPEYVPGGSKQGTCDMANVSGAANGSSAGTYGGRPQGEQSA